MDNSLSWSMIQPMLAMLGVTLLVWLYMYAVRLHHIATHNLDPQDLRTPQLLTAELPEKVMNSANNFKNLFEIPVLFYVLCVVIEIKQLGNESLFGISLVMMAWGYVCLRLLHSIIQCTYNKVMHRFSIYMLSCLVLWLMFAKLITLTF